MECTLLTENLDLSDQRVFSKFFEQTYVRLYRYLYGLTGGPAEDVEDILADVYARAWSSRYRFRGGPNAALCWLFRIAKNLVIDSNRKHKLVDEYQDIETMILPAPEPSPETEIISNERREILWRLLQTLPQEPREMLVLRYMLAWPVGEIARYMNKKETAVSMAIHRALKRLQQNWPAKEPVL
jgi:RNA polymerase sigma-70 factor (ECF subfamily)